MLRKAAVVSLIGYVLFILLSFYWVFEYSQLEDGLLPASKALLVANVLLCGIPKVCFAGFFVFVLRNQLKKTFGIAGAALTLVSILFARIVWLDNTDFASPYLWFYLIMNLSSAILLLLYFCNLQSSRISPRTSILGACVSFLIQIGLEMDTVINVGINDLSANFSILIEFVATVLTSVFFFVMAKNILKNGK